MPVSAYALALKKLSVRAYSEQEMRSSLQRAGCLSEEIDEALERLLQKGYLNDAKTAEELFFYYTERKPCGPVLLRHKLLKKGMPLEIISNLLTRYDEETENNLAMMLADKYQQQRPGKKPASLTRFLLSKGFRRSVVLTVLRNSGFSDETWDKHDDVRDKP